MKRCQAFDDCLRPAFWEVRGWPDEGLVTPMCSFHAEPFMDDELAALLRTPAIHKEHTRA